MFSLSRKRRTKYYSPKAKEDNVSPLIPIFLNLFPFQKMPCIMPYILIQNILPYTFFDIVLFFATFYQFFHKGIRNTDCIF